MIHPIRYLPDSELVPPCPHCGDKDRVQVLVIGMPAFPPSESEADRVNFAGCMINDDTPSEPWWCPGCEKAYPWTYPYGRTLLVKEPWVSLLLDGEKTWELRRSSTNVRGRVCLTPSGSGLIAGRADLIDVHGPFTADELQPHRDKHCVDDEFLVSYAAGEPLYAWEFKYPVRYESPAEYLHPQGAVIWVMLPLSKESVCEFCHREYPVADPYHLLCPEFPTGWDDPDDDW